MKKRKIGTLTISLRMVPMTDQLCRCRIVRNNGMHVFNGVAFSGKVIRIEQKTSFGFKPRVEFLDERPGMPKPHFY